MKTKILFASVVLGSFALVSYISINYAKHSEFSTNHSGPESGNAKEENLNLGAFSVSLNVQDLKTSKEFYENLGFKVFGGAMEKNYLIMKNRNSLIGLFHGMFTGNIMTFNPGWDENAANTEPFDDVRKIQNELKNKGLSIENEIDEKISGPAYFMLTDPDGNKILIDQHR
jgi:catechol 2,3-dioxygenase-like lactoylglutathione lyase family enzyme